MNDEKNSFKNPNFNNYSNINFETFLTQNIEVAIIIILIFICITGNSLLFFIICSNKHLRTPSNLFCMNLSLADFLIGSTILPYWAAATSWQAWYLSKTICSMMAFIYIALITSSTLTLAAISVDRYLCICHPLHYPVFMTHHRVYILIFFIWLLGILLACTPFWGWGEYKFRPQKIPICSPIFTGYVGYSSFLWTIIFFAPVVIILCSYCLILKAVKNQVQRIGIFEPQISQSHNDLETIRNSPNQNSSNHYRNICLFFYKHKSIKTFFIIIGAFFICWGPYIIVNVWSLCNKTQQIPYVTNLVTTFLAFSNSSVNPVLLICHNRDFRSCFQNIVMKIRNCCCHHRVYP